MNSPNTLIDPQGDHRFKELASLLAKGFLRLSKTPEWREQAIQAAPSRQVHASQKLSARSGQRISENAAN
jgi:hypothetical protein